MDQLSFKFVEDGCARLFYSTACSKFDPMCGQKYILTLSQIKKYKKKYFLIVCLTTYVWTSLQNINYMVITIHFIDFELNFIKKFLIFAKLLTIGKTLLTRLLRVVYWNGGSIRFSLLQLIMRNITPEVLCLRN